MAAERDNFGFSILNFPFAILDFGLSIMKSEFNSQFSSIGCAVGAV